MIIKGDQQNEHDRIVFYSKWLDNINKKYKWSKK